MNDGIGDPEFSWPCGFAVGCGGGVGSRGWGCMDEDEVMRREMDGTADLLAASRQRDILNL